MQTRSVPNENQDERIGRDVEKNKRLALIFEVAIESSKKTKDWYDMEECPKYIKS